MLLNYTYYKMYSKDSYHFNTGYKTAKKDIEKSKFLYFYKTTAKDKPIKEIFDVLKIA